ncbi:MAG: hypothetical protein WEB03_13310 [Nitriliruptor sp.]|uniref:toxin HicA n=1 Tax=Nitriliruptor sp. TaxID=2448056 RepID=UPI00349FEC1B
MAAVKKTLTKMRSAPQAVAFRDLVKVCTEYFGPPRQHRSSHMVFRTPWAGDPRVNIQEGRGGQAKPYQVRQVLKAIERMEDDRD